MDHSNLPAKKIKTILKFDVGADGFQKMIYVLAAVALFVLVIGILFLNIMVKEMKGLS